MGKSAKKAVIENFNISPRKKPYQLLFVFYKDEIEEKLTKGFTPLAIQLYLEKETKLNFNDDNFRRAFYYFKKKLEKFPNKPQIKNSKSNYKLTQKQQSMKKMTFIIQSKGGVGKSALTYMMANKLLSQDKETFEKTVFVDMDEGTRTTTTQLQFATINSLKLVSAKTKQIDRSLLDKFFIGFAEQEDYTNAICDMGATTSEQFLKFLDDGGSIEFLEALKDMLKIEFLCVVAGQDSFQSSGTFCHEIFKKLNGITDLRLVKNNLFYYSDAQNTELQKLSKTYKAPILEFNLIDGQQENSLKEVKDLMQEGKAAVNDSSFATKIRFNTVLKNFQYEA